MIQHASLFGHVDSCFIPLIKFYLHHCFIDSHESRARGLFGIHLWGIININHFSSTLILFPKQISDWDLSKNQASCWNNRKGLCEFNSIYFDLPSFFFFWKLIFNNVGQSWTHFRCSGQTERRCNSIATCITQTIFFSLLTTCQMHVSASWSFFYPSHIQEAHNVPTKPSPPPLMPPCKYMWALLSLFSSCGYESVFLTKQSADHHFFILLVSQLLSVGLLMTKRQYLKVWRILYCKCLACSSCSFAFFLLCSSGTCLRHMLFPTTEILG